MLSKLISMLKRHEGLSLKVYLCTGKKQSIGYGRNLDDVGISLEEAEFLLSVDAKQAIDNTHDIFPLIFGYTENRQIALIDMVFNLGKARFVKFYKMINAINRGRWDLAANEAMDSRWYNQVGERAVEIVDLLREG